MDEEIFSTFGYLFSLLLLYKYAAIFIISFLSALIVPFPTSAMLVASGAFASLGYFDILAVLAITVIANVAGDTLGYFIALRYGETFFHKPGLRHILRSRIFRKLREHILRFPRTVMFFSRFITEVGPATNVLGGLMKVPERTFLISVFCGELAYVSIFGLTGYFLGGEWENNFGFIVKIIMMLISLGVTLNLIEWIVEKKGTPRRSHS